ncbi:MAG: TolC family protein [Desulfovibrionaceae bacterium]|nr:TolC family protein [Desulfovibrionaceae bacterium]
MRLLVSSLFCLGLLLPGAALAASKTPQTSLKDSVNMTLRYNPSLKVMQESRQAAEFDRRRADSGFMPSLTLSGAVGAEQYSDISSRDPARRANITKDDKTFYERANYTLTLSQPIFSGLSSVNRANMADSMLTSAEQRLLDNAEALALDAILAHMELERQKKLLALALANVENHRNILKSQSDRQEAGAAARSDVTQTQARLARAESTLVETRLAYETAELNYYNLTGFMPASLAPVSSPKLALNDVKNFQELALQKNPKILASQADIGARRYQREMNRGSFAPTISLDLSHNLDHYPTSTLSYVRDNAVMLRGTWVLFNGNYDHYTLKGDNARIRQGNMELAGLRDNLNKEVAATWKAWRAAKEQSSTYASAVDYNNQTSQMYLDQFNAGQRSLLDILDSENELFSNSLMLVSAQMSEISAQYRLLALSGGLLDFLGVERKELAPQTSGDDE